jgi:hypothetical protein
MVGNDTEEAKSKIVSDTACPFAHDCREADPIVAIQRHSLGERASSA